MKAVLYFLLLVIFIVLYVLPVRIWLEFLSSLACIPDGPGKRVRIVVAILLYLIVPWVALKSLRLSKVYFYTFYFAFLAMILLASLAMYVATSWWKNPDRKLVLKGALSKLKEFQEKSSYGRHAKHFICRLQRYFGEPLSPPRDVRAEVEKWIERLRRELDQLPDS